MDTTRHPDVSLNDTAGKHLPSTTALTAVSKDRYIAYYHDDTGNELARFLLDPEHVMEYYIELCDSQEVFDNCRVPSLQGSINRLATSFATLSQELAYNHLSTDFMLERSVNENRLQLLRRFFHTITNHKDIFFNGLLKEVHCLLDHELAQDLVQDLDRRSLGSTLCYTKAMLIIRARNKKFEANDGSGKVSEQGGIFKVWLATQVWPNTRTVNLWCPSKMLYEVFLDTIWDAMPTTARHKSKSAQIVDPTYDQSSWSYRVSKHGKVSGDWYVMKDEVTYQTMIDRMRNAEGVVFLLHSTMKDEEERSRRFTLRERREADRAFAEVVDKDGEPFFERGGFFEYLESKQRLQSNPSRP